MKNGAKYVVTTHWGTFSLDEGAYQDYLAGTLWICWTPGKLAQKKADLEFDRNPIETIKTRLKSMDSITDKLLDRGFSLTLENIEQQLNDVAGVRVICGLPSDIYELADAFLRQDDVRLIMKKDYIANPKENGYRSLHLIVEIPIFLHDEKKMMKVEVQLRTLSMDWWASLEHKIRYKKDIVVEESVINELRTCAESAAALDMRMEQLQKYISEKTMAE